MYKLALDNFFKIRNMYFETGQDAVLLCKKDGNFYRVQEYIGMVVNISQPTGIGPQMPHLTIKFQGGQTLTTYAYVDDNIQVNNIVSIYGIITKNAGGNLELSCVGGMVRVFGRFQEAGRVNVNRVYRFGYAEISTIKESCKYPLDIEPTKLEEIEKDKLWVFNSNNIVESEKNFKTREEKENGFVDFNGKRFVTFPVYDANKNQDENS